MAVTVPLAVLVAVMVKGYTPGVVGVPVMLPAPPPLAVMARPGGRLPVVTA